MKITTGRVIGGKVVVDAPLEEGASVTVLAPDKERGFTFSAEEEAEIIRSIADADRGDTVPAQDVLAKLGRRHG